VRGARNENQTAGSFDCGCGLIVAISAFVHPFGMVKAQRYEKPLFAGAQMDLEVLQIFERSCQNCHSERMEWP
jgi:hypothetical protein